ncbi:hypothetical protein DFH11DRAFT_1730277 [Phellopilus nigrolimitatus]|nr:hypothetical protein DFH11DRAFT_1730277 [Phellopilus nigrolimitatus]
MVSRFHIVFLFLFLLLYLVLVRLMLMSSFSQLSICNRTKDSQLPRTLAASEYIDFLIVGSRPLPRRRALLVRMPAEHEQQIYTLVGLWDGCGAPSTVQSDEVAHNEEIYAERARGRHTFERDGHRISRGQGSRTSGIPDIVPFSLENAEKGSRVLVMYEPHKPSDGVVLPVSDYMDMPV